VRTRGMESRSRRLLGEGDVVLVNLGQVAF